jgi:HEAT repeat protein
MLIPCLWDDDPLLRGVAAEVLGQLRSIRARDVLKVKVEDPHEWVRQQATAALLLVEGSKTGASGWRPTSST